MNRSDVAALVRRNIASLCPYSTARDEYDGPLGVFLDANESPYQTGYNRYPDPHQKTLKEKIGKIKAMPVENIFIGNGSDEAIDLIFRVFFRPGVDNAVAISPSYGMYTVAAGINDIEVRPVQLREDFSLPAEELLATCDANTKAIFLCSPNNPSGNAFSVEELLAVVTGFKGMVVIDEAYVDFSTVPSLRSQVREYPNLLVLQTLSKAWGMAGLRLGLAFADKYVISVLNSVKYPYNINQTAQETVLRQLENPVDAQIEDIVRERGRVQEALKSIDCVRKIYPSDANFLLVKFDDADRMYGHLLEDRIIVRNRSRMPGCAGCLRITIGLKEENDRLIESLTKYSRQPESCEASPKNGGTESENSACSSGSCEASPKNPIQR